MLKKQSTAMRGMKVLFALPIIAISLALNAKTETIFLMEDGPDGTVPLSSKSNDLSTAVQGTVTEDDGDYLYIVDGKQMTDISGIPSSDIESMTVLKGDKARQMGYSRNVVIVKLKKSNQATGEFSPSEDALPVLDVCDQMPEFVGGMSGLMTYLMENIRYPKEAFEAGAQGRVLVKFIVNETGEVSDASIVQSVEEHLDKEALRVISSMPNWTPGKHKGKTVKVSFTIPVAFMLSGEDTSQKQNTDPDVQTMETTVEIENGDASGKTTRAIMIDTSDIDTKVYIDDVESSMEALKATSPTSIDRIAVDAMSEGGEKTRVIKVYTKK